MKVFNEDELQLERYARTERERAVMSKVNGEGLKRR